MRFAWFAIFAALMAVPGFAQEVVPEKRLIVTRDVDFYGADLQALFDTNLQSCERVCLNDPACKAFTFNTRSNACFPKSSISDRQPYEGAISAQVVPTSGSVLNSAAGRAADLGFLRPSDLSNALNEARQIGARHAGGEWTVEALLTAAREQYDGSNLWNALYWTGAAVAQSDASDQWADYARLSREYAKTVQNSDRRKFNQRGVLAAINAYLRAPSDPARVNATMELARSLETMNRGRDMIPTLRLAESIQPRADVTALLDDAIGKYGFRIVEHVVESNSADPRICADFSDPLNDGGFDYTPFLRLPSPQLAVESSGARICISGVNHGDRLTVTFRSGLPAKSGETLVRDVPLTLYVPDRAQSARFPGRGYVLPKGTETGIPVVTVNLTELDIVLRRVSDRNVLRTLQENFFGRPLNEWEERLFSNEIAEEIWRGTAEVGNTLNADVTTRLSVGEIVGTLPPGVYALSASVPNSDPYDFPAATQWFVLSDIGLTSLTGSDGLHVVARQLSDAGPMEGLEVALVSRANRVLARATTDGDGFARFDASLLRGEAGAAPAMLTARRGEDDYAFLYLTDPAFDLSDRGVAGRAPSGPLDAFLTTDRGAYRAGETIHATALMRDDRMNGVRDLPITAVLSRPDGVEYSRTLSDGSKAGGHHFALPIAATAPRGAWRLSLYADVQADALVSQTVLVEDFVPERIDMTLTLPDGPIDRAAPPLFDISSRYLFGAPGSDLPVSGDIRLSSLRTIDSLPGYEFGRRDTARESAVTSLPEGLRTNVDGKAQIQLPIPQTDRTDIPFELTAIVRVREGSGRPVERSITRQIAPTSSVIGIRKAFDDVVAEGTEAQFDLQAFDASLSPTAMNVRWTLNRVTTRYQWYALYGHWEWEPITTRKTIARGEAVLGGDPVRVAAPVEWGRYELVVERDDGTYTASSVGFYAGWYAPADASETPDTLAVSLDQPSYRAGDTATLRVVPRSAGTALVSVLSNRVVDMQMVELQEDENTLTLPVTDDWRGGVYVTTQLLRPAVGNEDRTPGRSLGLTHAALDPGAQKLNLSIQTTETTAPRGTLETGIVIDGLPENTQAYVTVAAVDLGILNLTGFEPPDPVGHYFGQRRLGVDIRDLYGRLIDGNTGTMGRLRSGGDAAAQMRLQSPPPTEEIMAQFSGIVETDANGRANVSFDLPDFNGTVRLMAVAWTDEAVGQASKDVIVRDPVVVTASLPRFLAPGDTSRLLLEMTHTEGPSGQMPLSITSYGLDLASAAIPTNVALAEGGKARIVIPLSASALGDHKIDVALTTPNGQVLTKSLTLGVRANDPAISTTRRLSLAPGQTLSLGDDVFTGFQTGSAEALVSAGPLARFDAPGLLASLDRYPYGCTEQVTSQSMPLLYLSSLADTLGIGNQARIDRRIAEATDVILTRQATNGAFGLWRAESGDFWLDAYVTDFLSRARLAGHSVPVRAFRQAIDNLKNRIAYAPDFDDGGEDIAYALMVLSREGAASMSDLRYYSDVKGDALATPMAQAQLASALAMYGDQTRADRMFAKAAARLAKSSTETTPFWRADYGTNLRDTAGLLTLAVEAGSTAIDRNALVARLGAAQGRLSTQEQSWALLAAHALTRDPASSGLTVNGTPVSGAYVRRFDGQVIPQDITNTGTAPTSLTITTIGIPDNPEPAGGYGYAIERAYYDMDGKPVSGPVQVGDRMVTVITVRPAETVGARLIIDDPLPAGLEIDNPNLLRSGDVRALEWLDPPDTRHAEFRSDRFIAAVDWRSASPLQLAYVVRAVSPGQFHHPAASVEDMYRPEYRARSETSRLIVAE